MKYLVIALALLVAPAANAQTRWDGQYKGVWVVTEGRPLRGTQTANIATRNGQEWAAVVSGTWQGQDYRYEIQFSGPADDLRGTAVIDGHPYDWHGTITNNKFQGNFRSRPYSGYFDMDRTK